MRKSNITVLISLYWVSKEGNTKRNRKRKVKKRKKGFTAIGSTEGAVEKFLVSVVFKELRTRSVLHRFG
jgi:hypothetical protein